MTEKVSLAEIEQDFQQNDWYLTGDITIPINLTIAPVEESDKVKCGISFDIGREDGISTLYADFVYDDTGVDELILSDVMNAFNIPVTALNTPSTGYLDCGFVQVNIKREIGIQIFITHPNVKGKDGAIWDYIQATFYIPYERGRDESEDDKLLSAKLEVGLYEGSLNRKDVHIYLQDVIQFLNLDVDAKIWECEDAS